MSGSDSNGSSADNVNRRVQKADYSILSQTFDQARHCSDSNVQFLLKRIETIVGTRSQVKFLDLGCGTGRFALPICEGLGYTVTGADSSAEMLAMARTKLNSHKVDWDLQEATGLTYV